MGKWENSLFRLGHVQKQTVTNYQRVNHHGGPWVEDFSNLLEVWWMLCGHSPCEKLQVHQGKVGAGTRKGSGQRWGLLGRCWSCQITLGVARVAGCTP